MNYLLETYGGTDQSHYANKGFCCYTIYDREYDMYYSGMKTYQGESHPVGITYFTSSAVVDFRTRFKNHPELFDVTVEYFLSLAEAADAEKDFHTKFRVGKNPKFYNVQISGGSHCGAGTVLCAAGDGTFYRVSKQEYANGGHRHTVKGTFLVRILEDNTLKRVHPSQYDPQTMSKQFTNHVLCYDQSTGKNRRIPKKDFESDPARFVGITKGKCTVYDKETNQKVRIDSGSIDPNLHYTNVKAKTVMVRTADGEIKSICAQSYQKRSKEYSHINSLYLVRLDLIDMKKKRISRTDYDQSPNQYADLKAKHYFETADSIFGSWAKLARYYGVSKWLSAEKIEALKNITIYQREVVYEDQEDTAQRSTCRNASEEL